MPNRIVDNLIAFRLLWMLVTPFEKTDAFKHGIIDAKGKLLRKMADLKTTEEKDAYSYLHRLVFNVKRIINKLPGGESKLKNIVAAYFLVKECYEKNDTTALLEEKFLNILDAMEHKNITLVEEEILVEEFMMLNEEDGGAPTNVTGANVSTDIPMPMGRTRRGRRFAQFIVNDAVYNKFAKGKKKFESWNKYLNLEDEGERLIYNYARKNPKGIIILKNGTQQKAIRFNKHGGGKWHKVQRRKPQPIVEVEDI